VSEFSSQLGDPTARRLLRAEGRCLARAIRETPRYLRHGGWWRPRTLAGWVRWHAKRRPHALAIVGADGEATWAELEAQIDAVRSRLEQHGIGARTTVAFSGAPGLHWLAAQLAALDLGACSVLADEHRLLQLPESVGQVRILSVPECGGARAARSTAKESDTRGGGSPAVWFATSGTEGALKLAAASHAKLMLSGFGFGRVVLELSTKDVVYCPVPAWHATGFAVGVASCLVSGARLVIPRRFSASRFWSDVLENQVTHIVHVGEMWRYVSEPAPRPHTVRVAIGGGMTVAEGRRVRALLSIPRLIEFYGSTELPAVMWLLAGEGGAMGHVPWRRLSRWFVARTEPDTGELLRDARGMVIPADVGEIGELLLRLPRVAAGSLFDLAAPLGAHQGSGPELRAVVEDEAGGTASKRSPWIVRDVRARDDRYYRTQDLVRFDHTCIFTFEGRTGDLIRQSGLNVSSRELEQQILCHAAAASAEVLEIAVLGVRESRRGPAGILVVVVPKAGYDRATLVACLRPIPRAVRPRYLLECEAIPRTLTFKIARGALESRWFAGEGVALPEAAPRSES